MSKPFDAVLNQLLDARLADWAGFLCERLGLPPAPAAALDTDLSTTLQADKVFRVGDPAEVLIHVEFESSSRLGIPDDLLRYNVLIGHVHRLPVHSVLVLLRPRAAASDQTGTLTRAGPRGREYLTFRYEVLRVWEEPFDRLVSSAPGVAPLALLTDEAAADLPAAYRRFESRLRQPDVPDTVNRTVVDAGYWLLGLRYDRATIRGLFGGNAMILEDSSTYQDALARGEIRGFRNWLLQLGRERFGDPTPTTEAIIQSIEDLQRLQRMTRTAMLGSSWEEVLATV